jgi:predicted nucleic acid-binding protein
MQTFTLDSYAVMEFLRHQKSHQIMADLFKESSNGNIELQIHILNWGEIWYTLIREKGEFLDEFRVQVGIEVVDFDNKIFEKAVGFKSKGNISYSDCFAISCAVQTDSVLVTGDREFLQFQDLVEILWL